ncbi:MAG: carbohydrate ABC transporter permease [Ruminococcaceae bacterium]|nr:carbohydrate ABC transporter permease [Oscillospiraceae bacterium]
MDTSSMTKKELKEYKKQLAREEAMRKIRAQEKTPFLMRLRYKYLTFYFLKQVIWALFRFVLLVGISYVILQPYISKIASSFMSKEDFTNVRVLLIAMNPTLDTYKAIITENDYFQALFNTTILSVLCGISQTLICTIVGYGFAKFKFRFKKLLFACVIFTMIVPHETIQFSMFMKFRYFDFWGIWDGFRNLLINLKDMFSFDGGVGAWYDAMVAAFAAKGIDAGFMDVIFSNPAGTIYSFGNMLNTPLPFAVLSFTGLAFKNGLFIYLMRQYFNGVPDELEEAAYVDGAGVIKTFVRIILPMSVTMMVTIFMFSFSWQWSDTFYTGLFYTNNKKFILLPNIVKIPSTLDTKYISQAAYETAIRNTCGLLILFPLVIVYLFAQRTLIEGVERSGITG